MNQNKLNAWGLLIVHSDFEELYEKQILAHSRGDFLVFELDASPSIQEYPDHDPIGVLYIAPINYMQSRAQTHSVALEEASAETVKNFILDYWLYP